MANGKGVANNLKNGGKSSRGGVRLGAGAKKKWYTILQERLIEERGAEAPKSFDLLVQIRDNPDEPTPLRKECAIAIMDRIWGKPKETLTHNLPNGSFISIVTHGEQAAPTAEQEQGS